MSGFGAALACGFGFRVEKCVRSFRVSAYGFLLSVRLGFLGL